MNSVFVLVLAIVLAAVVIAVAFNLGATLAAQAYTDASEERVKKERSDQ
jgi:multisubunit Na+/H+ antiporter MnhC subunit